MKSKSKKKQKTLLWLLIFIVIIIFGITIFGKITNSIYTSAYPLKYAALVDKYSAEYELDKAFVYAVIKTESSFNPNASSYADAYGLMQIQEPTFDWAKAKKNETRSLTKEDLFDPEINIEYGCYIYRLLIDEFKDVDTAIAAYHAGWGAVKKWLDNPLYSNDGVKLDVIEYQSTQEYVKKINETIEIYNKLYKFNKNN